MKSCFVICPIDSPESEVRKRSDTVLHRIIRPVVEELGYSATRADEISEPGIITSQIIERLFNDDLVIADLTGGNPNVYYELAVRHLVKRPTVHIILSGEKPHFDVSGQRMIPYDTQDIDIYEECKVNLKKQIQVVEKDPLKIDSPISQAIDTRGLMSSENPLEKNMVRILEIVQELKIDVATLKESNGSQAMTDMLNKYIWLYGTKVRSNDLFERSIKKSYDDLLSDNQENVNSLKNLTQNYGFLKDAIEKQSKNPNEPNIKNKNEKSIGNDTD